MCRKVNLNRRSQASFQTVTSERSVDRHVIVFRFVTGKIVIDNSAMQIVGNALGRLAISQIVIPTLAMEGFELPKNFGSRIAIGFCRIELHT
jgi:hypothetical protein